MADKLSLLFRRGTIDQILAGDKIVPGAVSFCTDEPGIYLDLTDAEAAGGAKRVRVGDFITVASFDDIKAQAANAADPDKAFSEHCLYYSIKENALMKYNKATKQFIVINDLTDVKASIKANNDAIISNDADILKLQNDLAQEITDRIDAVAELGNRLDALVGGEGDELSLAGLSAALAAEISAREDADESHNSRITAAQAKADTNETKIAQLNTLVGALPDGVSGTIVQYIAAQVLAEKTRAEGIEAGLRTDVNNHGVAIADNTAAITAETARATAAEAANAAAAKDAMDKATANATAITNEANKAREEEGKLNTKITNLENTHSAYETSVNGELSSVKADLATTTNTANDAKAKATANETAIANEKSAREQAVEAVANDLADYKDYVAEELEKVEENIGLANAATAKVAENLAQEITRAQGKEKDLGDAIAEVNTALNTEKTDRANADDALGKRIDNVVSNLSGEAGKVSTLQSDVSTLKGKVTDLEQFASEADKAMDAEAQARAKADADLDDLIKAEAAKAREEEGKLSSAIAAEATNRATAITNALATAAADAKAKDDALLELINQNMAAANSMTFKGQVSSYNDIPATGNCAGDTYVVINAFGAADSEPQIGDLLVIEADQAAGASFADAAAKKAAVIWVKTGYSTFNDPKLVVEDAKVKMKSHLGEVLGTVAVNSTSDNIVANITGSGSDATINVSFVWGSF